MAKLEIELRLDEEKRLADSAAQRGLSLADYARKRLLDDNLSSAVSAADVLARWQASGLAGAWADQDDIGDSSEYARTLRERTQVRIPDTPETKDAG